MAASRRSIKYEHDLNTTLYGPKRVSKDVLIRIRHDLLASVAALYHLYGGIHVPPYGVLTWPKKHGERIRTALMEADKHVDAGLKGLRSRADAARAAIDQYMEALRAIRAICASRRHPKYDAFCRAGYRHMKKIPDKAWHDDDWIEIALYNVCRRTRKAFGNLLKSSGFTLDPIGIDEQYLWMPENDDMIIWSRPDKAGSRQERRSMKDRA